MNDKILGPYVKQDVYFSNVGSNNIGYARCSLISNLRKTVLPYDKDRWFCMWIDGFFNSEKEVKDAFDLFLIENGFTLINDQETFNKLKMLL